MNDTKLSRNDLCHCGSGKKYKKCCLVPDENKLRPNVSLPFGGVPALSIPKPALPPIKFSNRMHITERLKRTRPRGWSPDMPPPANSIPVLPVEVDIDYTYHEPYGIAEVGYVFPGGRLFLLENGLPILNDDLKPGMRIQLQSGRLALVTDIKLIYSLPNPPVRHENNLVVGRVIGTVKHRAHTVIDVFWADQMATCTPDHRFYSVTRKVYVPAGALKPGELLETQSKTVVPVRWVSAPRHGPVDVYNVEVEPHHNYFVGRGENPVLAHNGGCIEKPIDLSEAQAAADAAAYGTELKWLSEGSVEFRGKTVQITEDLTHLTNEQLIRMVDTGWSPRNIEGEVIHLHHVGQEVDGALWELAESIHLGTPELHPLGNAPGVGLTLEERAAFGSWRDAYWQQRAAYELQYRGFR